MRPPSLLKTLVFPPSARQFSSSLRKMSGEKNQARNSNRNSNRRGRRSSSVQDSSRGGRSVSDRDSTYPMDGLSSASGFHANKCYPTRGPPQQTWKRKEAVVSASKCTDSHSGEHRDSAIGNRTRSPKKSPSCIEKNGRGMEGKSWKHAIPFESSEHSSIRNSSISQEDSPSVDHCQFPRVLNLQGEDLCLIETSDMGLQHPQYSLNIFDICPAPEKGPVKLAPSIFVQNKELRKKREVGQSIIEVRPGMILMKKYVCHNEQVEIIKKCRDLGIGPGGFYQPGYSDGAKLHLQMMCLGKNWDPETRLYADRRPIDDVKPPVIPERFSRLVEKALEDAHAYIKQNSNARSMLPNMKPDICIVNFYTDSGKLGLHQDRDESKESLYKGLPVVSFSLGDSAEFLYGDDRDVDKANKVTLESGDVLIFGGKSRHIYHGVPCIFPKTAPKLLLGDTNLRPGRLNLTFRQY